MSGRGLALVLCACATPRAGGPVHTERAYRETIEQYLDSGAPDSDLRALLEFELRGPPDSLPPSPVVDPHELAMQQALARADLISAEDEARRRALRWLLASELLRPTDRPSVAPIYADPAAEPATRALAAAALLRMLKSN